MGAKAEGLGTRSHRSNDGTSWRSLRCAACAIAMAAQIATPALASPRDQAKRIYERVAGVPPSASVLDQMAAKTTAGDLAGAAAIATGAPTFYNVTLKNFSSKDMNFHLEARNENLAPARDGRSGGARPSHRASSGLTCALRSCVLAMSNPEHRRARPASVHKLTDDGSGMEAPPALGLRIETIG